MATIDARKHGLRKKFPAMVRRDLKSAAECRTLYEDASGTTWCMWHGEFRQVSKRRFDDFPTLGVSTTHYIIDMDSSMPSTNEKVVDKTKKNAV